MLYIRLCVELAAFVLGLPSCCACHCKVCILPLILVYVSTPQDLLTNPCLPPQVRGQRVFDRFSLVWWVCCQASLTESDFTMISKLQLALSDLIQHMPGIAGIFDVLWSYLMQVL